MTKPFAPVPKPTSHRGFSHVVDCRPWMNRLPEGAAARRFFTSLSEAQEYCNALIYADYSGVSLRRKVTVADLVKRFIRHAKASDRKDATLEEYGYHFAWFEAFCTANGITYAQGIDREAIGEWRDGMLSDGLSNGTVRQRMFSVSAMFTWANDMNIVDGHPVRGMWPRQRTLVQRRLLTDDERNAVTGRANYAIWWRAYLITGLRCAELANMQKEQVRIDSPSPHLVVNGKGDRARVVPLTSEGRQVFSALLDEYPGDELFVPRSRAMGQRWRNDREALGIDPALTIHGFRHDFATRLVNSGCPLDLAMRVLGHSKITTTAIYLHSDESRLQGFMEWMDGVSGPHELEDTPPKAEHRIHHR